MKTYILIILLAVSSVAGAQIRGGKLEASGLTCAMCSKAVYKALSGVAFVEKVTPDIEKSSYDLVFKKDAEVNLDALSKAVTDAGFSVARLTVAAKFQDAKVQNDAHIPVGNQLFHFVNTPSQTLQGERTVRVIDKSFVPEKEAKKFEKLAAQKCYASGTMDGRRVYHVTL